MKLEIKDRRSEGQGVFVHRLMRMNLDLVIH